MDKIEIGGVRLKRDLVQVEFRFPSSACATTSEICDKLTRNEVNVSFFMTRSDKGAMSSVSFCVDRTHSRLVAEIMKRAPAGVAGKLTSPVALITFYPRRKGLGLLGAVLAMWGMKKLPLYGVATSLSSVSCATDDTRVEEILSAIDEHMKLPSNHTPFVSPLKVTQSSLMK